MGNLDALSREVARAHSERLWKQLVVAPDADAPANTSRTEILIVLGLAVAAALAGKLAALLGTVSPFHNTERIGKFPEGSDPQVLTVLHLPIALWLLAVGVAYVGGRWFSSARRMDFVRFSGELAIYYVLIALGGGVVTGFTAMLFSAIDVNPAWFIGGWLIPCGAAGAVICASWLVEAKQSVIENMAPVLTRLFTQLFTVLLLAFLATMVWPGGPIKG